MFNSQGEVHRTRQPDLALLSPATRGCAVILPLQIFIISRVSNVSVLHRAGRHRLSSILLSRQLVLVHEIARRPDAHPVRNVVFKPGTLELQAPPGKRRRGRPRQVWTTEVHRHANQVCESLNIPFVHVCSLTAGAWKAAVRDHCLTA